MIPKSERGEALAISSRLMAELISFNIASTGEDGANFRSAAGRFIAGFYESLSAQSLGTDLYACFELARTAGASLIVMDNIRTAMFNEQPLFPLGLSIVNAAIIFSFVEQSQLISYMAFGSRAEAAALLDTMGVIIEDIKLNKADSFVSNDYQNFVTLAAQLVQHLSATERQLPRVVQYQMPVRYPALTLSNRIYGDGSRSEELIAENDVVHPAFMQRDVIALSA
jgi:hypothetical protein